MVRRINLFTIMQHENQNNKEKQEKQDAFWEYFPKQYPSFLDSKNVYDIDGNLKKIRNRTNVAIKSYN